MLVYYYLPIFGYEKTYYNRIYTSSWFRELKHYVERGNPIAQYDLARHYHLGEEVNRDLAKAVEWYIKSAGQGFELAQINLGDMYYFGDFFEKDYSKAVEWYQKAAIQKKSMGLGQYKLGMCYLNGEGVPQDSKKAIKLFLKAANKGYYDGQIKAQIALGDCYKNGEGVRKNSKKAVEWYTKAACDKDIQCNREVQYKLAKCYEDGFGVEKDIIKAKILYRKAGNYPEASKALNDLLSNPANAEILKKHKKELKEYKNKAGEFYRKYSMANKWFNELSVKDCKKFMSQIKGMIIDGEYIPFEDVLKKRIIDFAENKNKVDECFRKRYSISEKEIRKWIPQTSDAEWEEYMQKYAPVVAVEEILHHQDSSFWWIY